MIDETTQRQLHEQYNPEGSMLREIQICLLDILSEVDRVCRENGLMYWIDSGTLLGAMRHRGFIPWDDDVDICILKKDYRRFCHLMREHLRPPYKIYDMQSVSGYKYKWPRIVNENVSIKRQLPNGTMKTDTLWVDALLMCNGHPSYVKKIDLLYGRCFRRVYHTVNDGWLKRIAGFVLFPFASLLVSLSRPFGKIFFSDTLVHEYASGFYSMRKVSNIFPLSTITFEGKEFLAPGNPDEYLKMIYGDYMTIPPIEKRESHNMLELKSS